jgi:hypothetical protein
VLRGLNATLGRTAGWPEESPWLKDADYCAELDATTPAQHLQDRYFLEYPHGALLLFRLGFALGNEPNDVPISPALLDGDFHNLVDHLPRNEAERRLWRHFRVAVQIYALLSTLCLLALMLVLKQGYEPGTGVCGQLYLLILPATLYFTLHRYDVVPALLTALSLACLGRRWLVAAAAFLGAATMIKVYPVLLAPLMLRYLSVDRRSMLVWGAAYGATLSAFLLPPLLLSGWTATWAPYHYQLSRQLESFSLFDNDLLCTLGSNNWAARAFRTGSLLITLLALVWRRPQELNGLLRRCSLLLIVFVSLQVFYSPQWLLWFCPLLVPLAWVHRTVGPLLIALDLVTYLSFPVVFDFPNERDRFITFLASPAITFSAHDVSIFLIACVVWTRFVILALLVVVLWRSEFGRKPTKPTDGRPWASAL